MPLPFVDEPDDLFPPDVLLPEADCDEVVDFLVTFELFDTTFFPEDCDFFCTLFLTAVVPSEFLTVSCTTCS